MIASRIVSMVMNIRNTKETLKYNKENTVHQIKLQLWFREDVGGGVELEYHGSVFKQLQDKKYSIDIL